MNKITNKQIGTNIVIAISDIEAGAYLFAK